LSRPDSYSILIPKQSAPASRFTHHVSRLTPLLIALCGALLLSACGDAAPVVKIGLIAPFEGLGRPLGYAALGEVKAALAAANAGSRMGRYRVLLVALNDDLDPRAAAAQAQALAEDPEVLVVLGPWTSDTAEAAVPVLSAAGIPLLLPAPVARPTPLVFPLCPPPDQVRAGVQRKAGGVAGAQSFDGDAAAGAEQLLRLRNAGSAAVLAGGPDLLQPWLIDRAGAAAEGTWAAACVLSGAGGAVAPPQAALARAAANALIAALSADVRAHGRPTRAGVGEALAHTAIQPDLRWYRVEGGRWMPAP
jgi:hypothetical protein